MARKNHFLAFDEAAKHGPYDEYPMLPAGIDPQIHLSRNDRPQPFHLICEHDTVLVTMSGSGRVEFAEGPVRYHTLAPGDFVYVPAGTAHRILPEEECVHLRYKPECPGLEAIAWYCDNCGTEMTRETWDTAVEVSQQAYDRICRAHNVDAASRICGDCGAQHPEIDMSPYSWDKIAAEIREESATTG